MADHGRSVDFPLGARHGVYTLTEKENGMPPDVARGIGVERSQLLQHYEAIAAASSAMLEAARAEDWDEVTRLEDRCRTLIAALKAAAADTPLSRKDNERRMDLLRKILADDAEIRGRAEPWLEQLEYLVRPRTGAADCVR
jgi:flagellar protein FliT